MVPEIQNDIDRILCHFGPFSPLAIQKIKNFEKMKNIPANSIILKMCTINHNHMMFGS